MAESFVGNVRNGILHPLSSTASSVCNGTIRLQPPSATASLAPNSRSVLLLLRAALGPFRVSQACKQSSSIHCCVVLMPTCLAAAPALHSPRKWAWGSRSFAPCPRRPTARQRPLCRPAQRPFCSAGFAAPVLLKVSGFARARLRQQRARTMMIHNLRIQVCMGSAPLHGPLSMGPQPFALTR